MTISSNHGKSLSHLKECATEHGKAPRDFRPKGNEAAKTAQVRDTPIWSLFAIHSLKVAGNACGPIGGIWPHATAGMIEDLVSSTHEVTHSPFSLIDPRFYTSLPALKMTLIFARGSRGANEDALIEGLKQSLCKDVPVVVDVKNFARYRKVELGQGDHVEEANAPYREVNKEKGEKGDYNKGTQWLSDSLKLNNGYIVDTNITGYGWEGAHAICICGYDSAYQPDESKPAVSAFKFKNSWGTGYGNQGYAWFTEDYVRQYTYNALVLEINGR